MVSFESVEVCMSTMFVFMLSDSVTMLKLVQTIHRQCSGTWYRNICTLYKRHFIPFTASNYFFVQGICLEKHVSVLYKGS